MHRKNYIKTYQTTTSFYLKKKLKLIKTIFFPVKKWKIQVILFMNMLTRSSERIFNPMRYSGIVWTAVISSLWKFSFISWLCSECMNLNNEVIFDISPIVSGINQKNIIGLVSCKCVQQGFIWNWVVIFRWFFILVEFHGHITI